MPKTKKVINKNTLKLEKVTEVVSPKFTMVREDWDRLLEQSIVFASPLIIMYLNELQAGKTPQEAAGYVYAALIQILINFLKKLTTEKTYTVKQ